MIKQINRDREANHKAVLKSEPTLMQGAHGIDCRHGGQR